MEGVEVTKDETEAIMQITVAHAMARGLIDDFVEKGQGEYTVIWRRVKHQLEGALIEVGCYPGPGQQSKPSTRL